MDDDDLVALAWCELLIAVIVRAIKDAKGGKLCNGHCKDGEHICAKDALGFLRSNGVAFILDSLGLDPGEIKDAILCGIKKGDQT